MSRRSAIPVFLMMPWWVLLGIALFIYVVLGQVVPVVTFPNDVLNMLLEGLSRSASLIALLFVGLALGSAVRAWHRGELLDSQTSLSSIQSLEWDQFEYLVGEAYRRRGYSVRENLSKGSDDGVDLVLKKEGKTTLVQCKQWRTQKIGAPAVREFLGAITAFKARHGIVICSNEFTGPAVQFAKENGIELVTGQQLTRLITSVQKKGKVQEEKNESVLDDNAVQQTSNGHSTTSVEKPVKKTVEKSGAKSAATKVPECPECSALMVLRTAKRGKSVGQKFWGCSGFPECRGTRGVVG